MRLIKDMHPMLPRRLVLLTTGCAVLSAVLWGWSRGLLEPNWESSAAPLALAPMPEPSPAIRVAATSAPKPKPKSKPAPPKIVPSPTPALVQATPVEPIPSAPPLPAPEPSPVVAEAMPGASLATPMPAPRPSEAGLAGPLPEHSPGEPAVAAATPASLDIDEIARQPQLWPPQVILVSAQRFPVVIKGVNVGNVQVPAGRAVTLRKVNADGTLEIEFQGSPAKVKAQATDLAARAAALAASREKAAPSF